MTFDLKSRGRSFSEIVLDLTRCEVKLSWCTEPLVCPSRSRGIAYLSKDSKTRKYSACGLTHRPYTKVKIWQPSHTINMINLALELNYSYTSHLHRRRLFSRLTDEIRDIFTALGSTMVKSLKPRDSWVFAGAYGINEAGPFEKVGNIFTFFIQYLHFTLVSVQWTEWLFVVVVFFKLVVFSVMFS